MIKIPLEPKNDWNDPKIYKMTEIPLKPKKWLKYPYNLKNDRNAIEPKNNQNDPKTFICKTKMTIKILYNPSTCFPPCP